MRTQSVGDLSKENAFDELFLGLTADLLRKWILQEQSGKDTPAGRSEASPPDEKTRGRSFNKPAERLPTQHESLQAERRRLMILEQAVGPLHLELARRLNNLAHLNFEQGEYAEAQSLYERSLAIVEEILGKEHPKVARRLANLAELYSACGKPVQADAFYQRAIAIQEKAYGPNHRNTIKGLKAYAGLLRKIGRTTEAEAVEARIGVPGKARPSRLR